MLMKFGTMIPISSQTWRKVKVLIFDIPTAAILKIEKLLKMYYVITQWHITQIWQQNSKK